MGRRESAGLNSFKYHDITKDPERLRRAALLAKNLNYLTLRHPVGKKELGAYVGVRYETITRYYRGQILPTPEKETRLAAFFGIRPEDLYSADRIIPAELRELDPDRLHDALDKHLTRYYQLSDRSRKQVDLLTEDLYWQERIDRLSPTSDKGLGTYPDDSSADL